MSEETSTAEHKEVAEDIAKGVHDLQEVIKTVSTEHKTLNERQTTLDEKLDAMSGEDQATFKKINADLEKKDKKHDQIVLDFEESKKKRSELEDRVKNMESQLILASKSDPASYKDLDVYKAINDFARMGLEQMNPELKTFLRTDNNEQGGFLVPEIMADEVLKKIEEISDVRRLSRVRSLRGVKTLSIPIRNSIPTASFEGEHETTPKTKSKYGRKTMTAHRQSIETEATWDQLSFSAFNMEDEILEDALTGFAQDEGRKFLTGTGSKQPQGILDASAGVQQVESAATGVVSLLDVIRLLGELKVGYNPVYFFNRSTLVTLRTEVGANGQFIWRFQGETLPTQINGINYVILQDMPAIANGSLSVGLGDFQRGYNILDAVELMMIRDNFTLASEASVNFNWHRWLDGMVVLSEAFKLIVTKS